jgi:hypothetical protein
VTLEVVRRPKRGDGAVSVRDQSGKRLKIPVWMLLPDSAAVTIADKPCLSKQALLALISLLSTSLHTDHEVEDNLLPKAVDRRKGGQHSAATTSGPDDPQRKRARTRGRKGAN